MKYNSRAYGITCWHVIEHFRGVLAESGNEDSHSMRTMVNGFYVVTDRFIRPTPQFGNRDLDIAIRELNPGLVSTIGKIPFDLDSRQDTPKTIQHGYAVGFPETMKRKIMQDNTGYRVSMPHVGILAEIQEMPEQRFCLFSELSHKPDQTGYSGISGGPIFWSTEDEYGIFGIIRAGGVDSALTEGKSVLVCGEYASPDVVKEWICQVHA